MAGRRWSEEERRELLAACAQSGMSLWAFARESGVPYTTLAYWRRRAVTAATPRLVPVEIERREDAHVDVIVGDVVVRVGPDFDDALLVRVVRTLRAC
jgi:transposase